VDVRWLTYDEMADALGIGLESASRANAASVIGMAGAAWRCPSGCFQAEHIRSTIMSQLVSRAPAALARSASFMEPLKPPPPSARASRTNKGLANRAHQEAIPLGRECAACRRPVQSSFAHRDAASKASKADYGRSLTQQMR